MNVHDPQNDPQNEKPTCLVLSGGGIRGFGLLGALQFLSEQNLTSTIRTYIGTSVGSIICYLLCIGYEPLDIVHSTMRNEVLKQLGNFSNIPHFFLSNNALVQFEPITEYLELMTLSKHGCLFTFQSLYDEFGVDFVCITYNYTKRRTEILHRATTPDLSCLLAIQMSSSIPYVFQQCTFQDQVYLDGGVVDNFPLRTAFRMKQDKVIGIVTLDDDTESHTELSLWTVLTLGVHDNTKRSIRKYRKRAKIITILDNNNVINFGVDLSSVMEMFSIGYRAAKSQVFIN